MFEVDLGKIKFKWRGLWNSSTTYTVDDVVRHGDASYVALTTSTNAPPHISSTWELMTQGGTTAITQKGDILYHDGAGLQKLAAPSFKGILTTDGTGNLNWSRATHTVGQIIQTTSTTPTGYYTASATNISVINTAITPQSVNSRIRIDVTLMYELHQDNAFWLSRHRPSTGWQPIGRTNSGGRFGWFSPDYDQNEDSTPANFHLSYVDTPNTTEVCTYGLWVQSGGGQNYYLVVNRSINDGASSNEHGVSNMILEEQISI